MKRNETWWLFFSFTGRLLFSCSCAIDTHTHRQMDARQVAVSLIPNERFFVSLDWISVGFRLHAQSIVAFSKRGGLFFFGFSCLLFFSCLLESSGGPVAECDDDDDE
jgi:hypothetical protein